jgi:hypothetical protein
MSTNKQVEREIFRSVSETCPSIDRAMDDALSIIKGCTADLREGMREFATRAIEAEDELDTAHETIRELEARIAELEAQLKEQL